MGKTRTLYLLVGGSAAAIFAAFALIAVGVWLRADTLNNANRNLCAAQEADRKVLRKVLLIAREQAEGQVRSSPQLNAVERFYARLLDTAPRVRCRDGMAVVLRDHQPEP